MTFKIVNLDSCFNWPAGYAPERELTRTLPVEWVMVEADCEDAIIAAGRDADVLLVERSSTRISRRVIEALHRCRLIGKYAIGVDNIDVAAATEHGIVVCNAGDYCVEEVSDHSAALILVCLRRIVSLDRHVQSGGWHSVSFDIPLRRLSSLTLGLVGFGKIARRLAQKIRGFSFRVLAADPYSRPQDAVPMCVDLVSLDRLLQESDIVSVHVPLTAETNKLIGERELRLMRSSAFLVNTSRGAVLDERALVQVLREGKLAGAALDVVELEPLPAESPLRNLKNVILTAHYAADSKESISDLHRIMGASVAAMLRNEWPRFTVNPEVKPRASFRAL